MPPLPDDPGPATEMYRHRADTLADDRGDGPALVLSHGTLMDRTMFRPQMDALADDYRVVAYDNRARTDNWQGPYDLDDLTDDCRTLLDALDIDSCVLGGMSMGGFMALRFALRYPEVLDGLVLVDSMAQPHPGEDRERYGGMVDRAKESEELPPDLAEVVAHILFGPTTNEEHPELVDSWKNRWLTYPGEAVHDEVHSWLDRPGVADRLDEIDVPTLVVHGAEDLSIDPEYGASMADGLPDARFVEVPEAGHSSNVENPTVVNDALREFMAEVY
ncbi:alpha/beta fold hydrolase [Haloarchaeobius salinus]|uniref:alpha/beta fold hydrolase n=1 Tax=Haloarchaeobius salinus TaxID=1198298 RepID=UPI0021091445|nr:alpha/beta fold hydrolase [Haloarchaeobius salinus]